jgi:hypothetical protein
MYVCHVCIIYVCHVMCEYKHDIQECGTRVVGTPSHVVHMCTTCDVHMCTVHVYTCMTIQEFKPISKICCTRMYFTILHDFTHTCTMLTTYMTSTHTYSMTYIYLFIYMTYITYILHVLHMCTPKLLNYAFMI